MKRSLFKVFFILSIFSLSLSNFLRSDTFMSTSAKNQDIINYFNQIKDKLHQIDEIEFENNEVSLQSWFNLGSNKACLPPKDEAVNLLKKYGISNNNPDENLRFIIGKCDPIMMTPGIYSTKFYAQVNCKYLKENDYENFKNMRLYCGNSICKDESSTNEERPLFVSVFDEAFTILESESNKYSACLSYFIQFYQTKKECPNTYKNMCKYSPYIKIGYYGGTSKTKSNGKCGTEAIQNLIQTGFPNTADKIVNVGAAKSFASLISKLKDIGYNPGFSMGGLPNDYRRYIGTNNFAKKVFRYQIERLYANTGKQVVLVGHSYGTLVTLSNLLDPNNSDLLPKIKKFIAIAPPFAGASKLLDAYLHGMKDWNKSFTIFGKEIKITNYDIFAQRIMYKSMGTIFELRPLSISTKLFNSKEYSELGNALRERFAIEEKCKNKDCSKNEMTSQNFDKIFKGYFPSLLDQECKYESSIGGNSNTFNRKCYLNMYNIGDCPLVIANNNIKTVDDNVIKSYCGKNDNKLYYQGECGQGKKCVDEIYYTKGPNPYGDDKINFFINRYNQKYASQFDGKIDKSYFESYDLINKGIKESIDQHTKISKTKDLEAPPVDTDIIYASFAETHGAFVLNENDFTKEGITYYKGGDNTVPNWSSLLTGMKWIYDKQKKGLKQNFKLIEYCSRLSDSGKYKYDYTKNQSFIALGCSCLNSKNQYTDKIKDCTHAALLNDNSVINYVINQINDPNKQNEITKGKTKAAKTYNQNAQFENECNDDLWKILDTAQ